MDRFLHPFERKKKKQKLHYLLILILLILICFFIFFDRISYLELLPPEALEHLDIPVRGHASSHVKKVITNLIQRQAIQQCFRGIQIQQDITYSRAIKLFMRENKVLSGGYRISNEVKAYMQTCKVVVSTCRFSGGDDLYQPINWNVGAIPEEAFWDEIAAATQEAGGKNIDEENMIGKWQIVVVKDLPFTDQCSNGKIPKVTKNAPSLSEASVIEKELTSLTNLFMCLWFNEVDRFTSRDQLSFPYVLRQLNMKNIKMFPCVRKDLVNSMGHKQKAKPLTN
ncbi:hypothetical protein MKX01_008189 [Papaver californicum]|nr:hypothetical protein MKX01_008189 [Papaver californicum]